MLYIKLKNGLMEVKFNLKYMMIISLILLMAFSQLYNASADELRLEVLNGDVVLMENLSTILTSDIVVDNNSTLILRNMDLQLSIRGEKTYNIIIDRNSTLILENTNITSLSNASTIRATHSGLVGKLGSSIIGFQNFTLQNSSIVSLNDFDLLVKNVNGSMNSLELVNTNCSLTIFNFSCPTVSVDSSSIGEMYGNVGDLECRKTNVRYLNVNCSVADLEDISSISMKIQATEPVSITRASADTSSIFSEVNTTITDSSFGNLTMGQIGQAYNVTILKTALVGAGGTIYAFKNSTIERYWYLTVNVTDLTNFPIPAKIEIYDHDKNLVKTVQANVHGMYYEPTLAEIVTDESTSFIGNYRLVAYFNITEGVMTLDTISTEKTIKLDTNIDVKLRFADVILGLSSTEISLERAVIRLGDNVEINGTIEVPVSGEVVEVTYSRPDGTEFLRGSTTDNEGKFINEIQTDMEGRWAVTADWINGSSYLENPVTVSRKEYFYVDPAVGTATILVRVVPVLIIVMATIIGIAFLFIKTKTI